jgi:hypothetical protein
VLESNACGLDFITFVASESTVLESNGFDVREYRLQC